MEIPKDEEDEQQILASEAELERIKHIYGKYKYICSYI